MSESDQHLYHRAVDVMPGGNTRSTLFVAPHPPYAVRGSGAEVTDSDGRSTSRIMEIQVASK